MLPRLSWLRLACLAALFCATPGLAREPALTLRVVGGLEGVTQYQRHELPFWRDRVPALTDGAVRAEIVPFDRSGLRAQEMVGLIRLGVIPFGYVLTGPGAAEQPLLGAFDVPLADPDLQSLRARLDRMRPRLEQALRERYGLEMLAVYTHPAQMIFCRSPVASLADLAGRRVRASGVGQVELMLALGAQPSIIPFAEMRSALRAGTVDCAITGTLAAYETGLAGAVTHMLPEPISWGVSFFAANRRAWAALPEASRNALKRGLTELERDVWAAAEEDTRVGLSCLTRGPCPLGEPAAVALPPTDHAAAGRRREVLLRGTVLPAWFERCGQPCADLWDAAAEGGPR